MPRTAATVVESGCQIAWLATVMSLAGAAIRRYDECPDRSRYRVALRISDLGYAIALDVRVCSGHRRELRTSPYYVESEEFPVG